MLLLIKFFRCVSWAVLGFALGAITTLVFLLAVWHGVYGKRVSDFAALVGYHDVGGTFGPLGALLISVMYGGLVGGAITLILWLAVRHPPND